MRPSTITASAAGTPINCVAGNEVITMSQNDLDGIIAAYDEALQSFVRGDPSPVADLYSRRDDVTLANPLGPPQRGRASVEQAIAAAAANFRGGAVHADEVSRYSTPDVGYVVRMERYDVRLAGSEDTARIVLRATMIFRREGNDWRIVHRHADPIATVQSLTAMLSDVPSRGQP